MKKYIYIPLFLAVLLVASAERSYACSCVFSPEPLKKQVQGAFSSAAVVFSGEVVEIKDSPTNKYDVLVKLKVANVWKGEATREITINTAKDSAMCGYNFEVGKKYLVYAYGLKDNLSTTNCSRTSTFNPKGDIKYLDKLKRKKTHSN
jgi:Tissue inhibitor of metalloproteinase